VLYNNNNLSEEEREQTPIEDYDDVVAYAVEGEFCGWKLGTSKLNEISLSFISDEIGAEPFDLKLSDGVRKFEFDEYTEIVDLLSQISGLWQEREALMTGFTSWSTDIILIEDTQNSSNIASDVNALATALIALQEKAEKASAK